MKKWITLILALALAFTLAACGSEKPATPGGSGTQSPADTNTPTVRPSDEAAEPENTEAAETEQPAGEQNPAVAAFIGTLKGGKYSFDYSVTQEIEGEVVQVSANMAIDGGQIAMTMVTAIEGETITQRVVVKDNTAYLIDDESKMIMAMADNGTYTEGMVSDYSDLGIQKIGAGTGDVNGEILPYEEYSNGTENIKFYFKDNQIRAMETSSDDTTVLMVISNIQSGVPAGAFDLPEDYEVMDLAALTGMAG